MLMLCFLIYCPNETSTLMVHYKHPFIVMGVTAAPYSITVKNVNIDHMLMLKVAHQTRLKQIQSGVGRLESERG